jgi:hypothetical protein
MLPQPPAHIHIVTGDAESGIETSNRFQVVFPE